MERHLAKIAPREKQGQRDSNPQPADLESAALPIEPCPYCVALCYPLLPQEQGIVKNPGSTPIERLS